MESQGNTGSTNRTDEATETHFGFSSVRLGQKQALVDDVFHKVARRYDLMNDLMSAGLHRLWKAFTLQVAGARTGERVLDIAGGTGDLSRELVRTGAALVVGGDGGYGERALCQGRARDQRDGQKRERTTAEPMAHDGGESTSVVA